MNTSAKVTLAAAFVVLIIVGAAVTLQYLPFPGNPMHGASILGYNYSSSTSSIVSSSSSSSSSSVSSSSMSSSAPCVNSFAGADFQAVRLSHTYLKGRFTVPKVCPGYHTETLVKGALDTTTTYSFPNDKWGASEVSYWTTTPKNPFTLIGQIFIKDAAGNNISGSPFEKSVTLSDRKELLITVTSGFGSLTVQYSTEALRGDVRASTDGFLSVDDKNYLFADSPLGGVYTFTDLTPLVTITVRVWTEYELNPGEWITTEEISTTAVPSANPF